MDTSFNAQEHHAPHAQNVRLRYARSGAADETRRNVDVKFPGPFAFEGREWIATSLVEDGFTLCVEHERTFKVRVESSVYVHKGPLPTVGEFITLDDGTRVRVNDVAPAHHDSQRGSFRAERI